MSAIARLGPWGGLREKSFANQTELKIFGKILCYVNFENKKFDLFLIVVDDLSKSIEAILGRDFPNVVKLSLISEKSLKLLYDKKYSINAMKDNAVKLFTENE